MKYLSRSFSSLGGNFPSSDTTNVGEDTIDFILEAERETRVLPGKSYSWIKCNRNFENFLVTEYSFPTITWQRFTSVLEAQPTVSYIYEIQFFYFILFHLVF